MEQLRLIDIGIWLVYVTLATLLLWIYRNSRRKDYYSFFLKGFAIKVFGGMAFALIYIYYYGFGDSFLYHKGASVLSDVLLDAPEDYFRLLFSKSGQLPPDLSAYSSTIAYSNTFEEWFMVKLLSPISLISFKSYFVSNFFTSLLAFWGSWKLFQVFIDIIPDRRQMAFALIFLMPSVIFWGGGLMKDTITLCGINFLIYYLYFMLVYKRNILRYSIGVIIWGYLVFNLKSYILIAFIPGALMFVYFHFKSRIESRAVRIMLTPFFFFLIFTIGYLGIEGLSTKSQKYSVDELEYKVKGFHSWHTDLGGSSYDLGEFEFTPLGIVSKIPASLNVTFFRPYLWESRSPVVLLGAMESLLFLFFFLRMLFIANVRTLKYLRESPFLMGMLSFVLIFGFAVGFTSYNFGALARYKIPILALFAMMIYFVIYRAKKTTERETAHLDAEITSL